MYCKNVITFEQINYKQSKNHYKQLQTTTNDSKKRAASRFEISQKFAKLRLSYIAKTS